MPSEGVAPVTRTFKRKQGIKQSRIADWMQFWLQHNPLKFVFFYTRNPNGYVDDYCKYIKRWVFFESIRDKRLDYVLHIEMRRVKSNPNWYHKKNY